MLNVTDLLIVLGVVAILLVGKAIARFLTGPPPIPKDYTPEVPFLTKPMHRALSVRDRMAQSQRRAHAREVAQLDQSGARHE